MKKLMMKMMKMIPRFIADKMRPPMLSKEKLAMGRTHHTIKMNLSNLLICGDYCGTCPSFPSAKGEALYCATGKSSVSIEENGCNCITCPLLEKCSSHTIAYFCINGYCSPKYERSEALIVSDLAGEYLQRFIQFDEPDPLINDTIDGAIDTKIDENVHDVNINYAGEREIETKSNISILNTSLNAGIPHTHVCGGRARCSTCRVLVTEGINNCRPRNELESNLARIKGFSPEVRLACQTTLKDNVSLRRLVLDEHDISDAIFEGRRNFGESGKEIEAAILFSDIRSFTSFSEVALPYDVTHILNRYFDTIGEQIDLNGGYIDKYMGDGIMAIYGLDKEVQDHPSISAVKSALLMQESLIEFNIYLKKQFNHEFRIGVGIHTGVVIVGNLGFRKKKEFTAIGDTVNTASRIESLNKKTGTSILVSRETYRIVKDHFIWGKKYSSKVKGKELPINVYEPVEFKN